MSMPPNERRRGRGVTAAALVVFSLAAGLAAAQRPQEGDLLEQVRRREEVARQKIEAEIRGGLLDVQRLGASNPDKALDRLKGLQLMLENDTSLTADRRERLQSMVRDRVRVATLDQQTAARAVKGEQPAGTIARQLLEEQAAERERLRREIDAVKQQKAGTGDSGRQAADAARRGAANPAATAAGRINAVNDQISGARRVEFDRQRALAGVHRDLERTATPPGSDWELPKDWFERTKNRTAGQALTAKEKTLLSALASPVQVNFKNSRFDDVIEYLQTLMGQPILIDATALKEAEITYETPVTLNAKGVTVRTALKKILAELGLGYVIKEETIQVTTLQRSRETMVVRSYPVGDLVSLQRAEFGQFGGRPVTPLELKKNVDDLIQMIQSSVDPGSWQANGGTGTIAFHAPSNTLIIKQTAEVHMMMGRR